VVTDVDARVNGVIVGGFYGVVVGYGDKFLALNDKGFVVLKLGVHGGHMEW